MSDFEYPGPEDWIHLAAGIDWDTLRVHDLCIACSDRDSGDLASLPKSLTGTRWLIHLQNRLADVFVSYIMARFYLSKGIPDEPWYISPGRRGNNIEYFPNFEEVHFTRKAQYDYYVDVFYYKLFSAFDTLGHLLDTIYDLDLPSSRVYLATAVDALAPRDPTFHGRLKQILDSRAFREAHSFRIAITHNSPPNEAGPLVASPAPTGCFIGVGTYTCCATFMDNMHAVLTEAALIITLLKQEGVLTLPPKQRA